MTLTAASFDAGTKTLRLHVRTQVNESGYDTEIAVPQNHGFPVNGGIYDKHMLVVYLTMLGQLIRAPTCLPVGPALH